MVSGFICGTNSLPRDEDGEHERQTRSADSSPRKSRSKSNKNPYSTRGLDRFSALLTEIEEKRQRIYSKVDPQEISLVRFVYTDDHEFKPIVVKAKSSKGANTEHQREKQPKPDTSRTHKSGPIVATNENPNNSRNEKMMKKAKICNWMEPKIYLPMIVIAILVCLLAFNRSFAIMCTSIGWYVLPTIINGSYSTSNLRTSFKKKDFAKRKLSDKKIMSTEGTKSFKHPRERVVNGGRSSCI
ncbi:uncharacterized protein LOC141594667 [Silene latifolia]|uniref:uncharacterized protein LOC141594667 n=1 Tax=Silene latifolia TaxID=37657 RepID=UPI003D77224C